MLSSSLVLSVLVQSEVVQTQAAPKTSPFDTDKSCRVTGCSSELCVDSSISTVPSLCEWRQEYACYREATCEVQENGNCGWTFDDKLKLCLEGSQDVARPTLTPAPSPVTRPTPTIAPTPTTASGPKPTTTCGNRVCEIGEANTTFCPSCDPKNGPCVQRACTFTPGTCPKDCPDTSADVITPGPQVTLTPMPSPGTRPTLTTTPTPTITWEPEPGLSRAPSPAPSQEPKPTSFLEQIQQTFFGKSERTEELSEPLASTTLPASEQSSEHASERSRLVRFFTEDIPGFFRRIFRF